MNSQEIVPKKKMGFCETARALRAQIKTVAKELWAMQDRMSYTEDLPDDTHDTSEMNANVILAYRHLEDAAMRLGKAIQAYDGGVSVYDK